MCVSLLTTRPANGRDSTRDHAQEFVGLVFDRFRNSRLGEFVNAPTALFAAESLSRNSPISTPRFFPSSRIAFNFNPSLPRSAIFGINAAAFNVASERSSVSIELISATVLQTDLMLSTNLVRHMPHDEAVR